jgi:hypothetical protein
MVYLYLLIVVWVVLQVFWLVNPSASYFSLIPCCQFRKWFPNNSSLPRKPFTKFLPGKVRWIHRHNLLHTRPAVILLLAFVAEGKCLQSRWLETKGRLHLVDPLPHNHKLYKHTDTKTDERVSYSTMLKWSHFAMIYTSSFAKTE